MAKTFYDINLEKIVVNEISNNEYRQLDSSGQLKDNEIYITPLEDIITTSSLTPDRVLVSSDSGKIDVSTNITRNELNMLNGVSSNIQTQLNSKQPTITVATNRAIIYDGNGKLTVSAITSTELGYLDNAKSNIQSQINTLNSRHQIVDALPDNPDENTFYYILE